MSTVYQIDKLDEKNYDFWSIQMRSLLVNAELWAVASGQSMKSDDMKTADVLKWETKDEKALALIILNIKSTQMCHIKHEKTSFAAWTKLKQVHQPHGPARKVSLYKKLINLGMADHESASQHLSKFSEIVDKLSEIGIAVGDELLVLILLSSLPKSFENFVIAMEIRDSLPTLEVLKAKILEESARKMRDKSNDYEEHDSQKAFLAQSTSRGAQKQGNDNYEKKSNGKSHLKCFNCGKRGHFAAKCKARKQPQERSFSAAVGTYQVNNSSWCIDSGATSHMCGDRNMFEVFEEQCERIALACDNYVNAVGKGVVRLTSSTCTIKLKDVLYIPGLKNNFISVSKAVDDELTVIFEGNSAVIKSNANEKILTAQKVDNLFIFEPKLHKVCYLFANDKAMKWHCRFGHLNYSSLQQIANKDMVRGFDVKNFPKDAKCEVCMKSKIHVQPFPKASENRATQVLDLIHTDVCGPFNTASIGGAKYFVTFTDDMSRRIFVYFIKRKDEVFEKFKLFKSMAERQTGAKIKKLRSDNGREYINKAFDDFLNSNGILRQLTVAYTPQQNGVAERLNRTLTEMARSMLIHAGMKDYLWAEAISTAAYLRNRCPTKSLQDKTPYEAWAGRKPIVSHFRIFGSLAVALNKAPKSKFQARGEKFYMVGYSLTSKAYRLYDPVNHRVVEKRDVEFDENIFDATKLLQEAGWSLTLNEVGEDSDAVGGESAGVNENVTNEDNDGESNTEDADGGNSGEEGGSERAKIIGRGRPRTIRTGKPGRPSKRLNILNSMNENIEIDIPQTYKDVMSSPYREQWRAAMQKEYSSLIDNNTWTLTTLPEKQKPIGCKWVFSLKKDQHGEIERFKARLVAKGCSQIFGVNYFETFSPVVRYATIRMVIALAVTHSLYLHQLDITTAYLNSDLAEDCYILQPEGFVDNKNSDCVLKLNKAIYGLKQSGREWNSKLDSVLKKIGFEPCVNEPCLYKKLNEGKLNLIAIYVDDLIVACASKDDLEDIKAKLSSNFVLVDKGPLNYFLGMEVEREGETGAIAIGQKQYVKNLLTQYDMSECRPRSTPLDPGCQIKRDDDNQSAQHLAKNHMYHARTKHIDIKYHHVREVVKNENVKLEYVPTNFMVADVLTKNLPKEKHGHLTKLMGLY